MRQISFDSIYPNPENLASICPDAAPIVDFDTPAGRTRACPRTHADRIVLALRYPTEREAQPLAVVAKNIAGRVTLLLVYDADVLVSLLRMGWEVAA